MNEQDLSPPPALRRAGRGFLLRHGAHLVALGFGSGLSPMAPGTAGTLWAWLAFLCINFVWAPGDAQWGLIIATTFGLGWWASTLTARHMGVSDPGQHRHGTRWRPSGWCCGWPCPWGFWGQLTAFVLFRYFDAAKPGPVAWADSLFKGFGWRGGLGHSCWTTLWRRCARCW
jgi:phosphatidylglycerophosphatase A